MRRERRSLPTTDPGTERFIEVLHWGQTGPKAILQAGLHADEPPGRLVLHHLAHALSEAEAAGRLVGRVVMVPIANPIGLSQRHRDHLSGRFDADTGVNFNRLHLDLSEAVDSAFPGPEAPTVAEVRAVLRRAWETLATPLEASAGLRRVLAGLALEADLVLDLHCDSEAILHVYGAAAQTDAVTAIAAFLQAPVVLLADQSGDLPFDESLSWPWVRLARRFPTLAWGTTSVTVELRGATDVDDALAARDAAALFRLLVARGMIAGAEATPVWCGLSAPLDGVDMIAAPCPGLVLYRHAPGDRVTAGETVAEVLDAEGQRHRVTSRATGIVFARLARRLVRPGDIVLKVAGETSLAHRTGALLTA